MLIKQSKSVTQLFIYRGNIMQPVLKLAALSAMLISCGINAAEQNPKRGKKRKLSQLPLTSDESITTKINAILMLCPVYLTKQEENKATVDQKHVPTVLKIFLSKKLDTPTKIKNIKEFVSSFPYHNDIYEQFKNLSKQVNYTTATVKDKTQLLTTLVLTLCGRNAVYTAMADENNKNRTLSDHWAAKWKNRKKSFREIKGAPFSRAVVSYN